MSTIAEKIAVKCDAAIAALDAAKANFTAAHSILSLANRPFGELTDDECAEIMAFIGATATVPDSAPSTPRLKQSDKGSKAWNEGRTARDTAPIATCPHKKDTAAAIGWGAGFDERCQELMLDIPEPESVIAPAQKPDAWPTAAVTMSISGIPASLKRGDAA